jgi:hypothetical protein
MSILFVLLMFLLVIRVRYFIEPHSAAVPETEVLAKPQSPRVKREYGFEIPQDYAFQESTAAEADGFQRCSVSLKYDSAERKPRVNQFGVFSLRRKPIGVAQKNSIRKLPSDESRLSDDPWSYDENICVRWVIRRSSRIRGVMLENSRMQ